jgi:hypothetical protein
MMGSKPSDAHVQPMLAGGFRLGKQENMALFNTFPIRHMPVTKGPYYPLTA